MLTSLVGQIQVAKATEIIMDYSNSNSLCQAISFSGARTQANGLVGSRCKFRLPNQAFKKSFFFSDIAMVNYHT
jgi:hypothetical protein